MEPLEPYLSLAVAAAAGLLIGLEREQSAPQHQGSSFLGGARTHPLFALVAAVAMLLERQVGWAAPVAAFAALVTFLVVNYADDVRRGADRGLTSEAAFLLSFLLGALATSRAIEPTGHRLVVVAALAVVATLLLSAKPVLHPFVSRVSRTDVTAALKFLIVAVVVLPLLPDRAFGPYGALNPRSLGWMVVLISGISFVGYAAVRLLGPERGLGLTGLVGGLASSTAVTLSMSARAREKPALAAPCALAVVAASTVMCARVAVLVGVLNAALLAPLIPPLLGMGLGGLGAWLWLRRRPSAAGGGELQIANPFELSTAFKFGLFFAVVLVGSRLAADKLGAGGVYVAGVLAGTTDVDTIALSMAELAGQSVALQVGATAVALALFSHTVVKGALAALLGGAAFGRTVALAFGAMVAGGLAGLLLSWR